MSRNCARITQGALIEQENFDRRKRREHGDVVVTYTPLTFVINLETQLAIFANSTSCHKFASSSSSWNSHEPVTKLNRVTWFWTLCQFTGSNWLARISSESSMLFNTSVELHSLNNLFCFSLHPGDLYPYTRKPLFVLVDSDNSSSFQVWVNEDHELYCILRNIQPPNPPPPQWAKLFFNVFEKRHNKFGKILVRLK